MPAFAQVFVIHAFIKIELSYKEKSRNRYTALMLYNNSGSRYLNIWVRSLSRLLTFYNIFNFLTRLFESFRQRNLVTHLFILDFNKWNAIFIYNQVKQISDFLPDNHESDTSALSITTLSQISCNELTHIICNRNIKEMFFSLFIQSFCMSI